jgi:chromosome segregation ATPase
MIKMNQLHEEISKKEQTILDMEAQRDVIKSKLQDSYKEYLIMNNTIMTLKKEAEHGSDVIIARNEALQRNMEKLSKDFETVSKELSAANLKMKEMEFELE